MSLFEIKLLNEFNTRHSLARCNEAWLQTAKSFLNESLSSQKGNYDEAASLLASSGLSNDGLNTLAYASFCFWHRPLGVPECLFARGVGVADWEANERLTKLVCQKELSADDRAVFKEVSHLLSLACVALKARSLREGKERGKALSFQIKMLKEFPQRLTKERYLIEAAKKWPDCRAICVRNKLNPVHPLSFEEAFSKIHLKDVSQEAAKVFCKVADEFFPDDFGGVSSVCAYLPNEGKGRSGSYGYSNGKGHLVIPDSFCSSVQTLPAFLAFTAHEVLHMHQARSVERLLRSKEANLVSSSPFYAESLPFNSELRGRDFPCLTFMVRGDCRRNAHLPNLAYAYRSSEFLAHKFGDDLQQVLTKRIWNTIRRACVQYRP